MPKSIVEPESTSRNAQAEEGQHQRRQVLHASCMPPWATRSSWRWGLGEPTAGGRASQPGERI